jgi:hypothetical protein
LLNGESSYVEPSFEGSTDFSVEYFVRKENSGSALFSFEHELWHQENDTDDIDETCNLVDRIIRETVRVVVRVDSCDRAIIEYRRLGKDDHF